MTNKDISTSLKEQVEKAKLVGFDKVPSSTNQLELDILALFDLSQKILTAKSVCQILGQKQQKWYSDKLWYLAKAGKLVKLETRGYYQSVRKD